MKMARKLGKSAAIFTSCSAFMLLSAGVASAHVTVSPKTSNVGAWEKYTMRVPTEKNIPTVKVVLKVPNGFTFEQYEPVSGWSVTEQKDTNGQVSTVIWAATAGGIAPGQFQEFSFVAQNPKSTEDAPWDAFQYYQDQSIVEWTGDEGSQTPHAITEIMASTSSAAQNVSSSASSKQITGTSTDGIWSMILSVIAIVLAAGSVLLAIRLKRR